MKRLDRHQRDYYADFCAKFALMSAAAWIFGQFVPDQDPKGFIVVIGFIITIAVIMYGGYLKRLSN